MAYFIRMVVDGMEANRQDNQIEAASPIEMLTVEEFAKRMKVCRTTVFQWIKEGVLVQGEHYIRLGRVIRFPWGPELIQALKKPVVKGKPPAPRRKRLKATTEKSVINFEYR